MPTAAFLADSNKQALKHHVSKRKAAAEAKTPYSIDWRILKKLEQTQVSNQRHIGPLSALDNKAANELLCELTAYSADVQLYNDGTVPKVIHKTSVIRSAKRHAAMLGTDLRNFRGPPRKELRSTTKAKRMAFANANLRTN